MVPNMLINTAHSQRMACISFDAAVLQQQQCVPRQKVEERSFTFHVRLLTRHLSAQAVNASYLGERPWVQLFSKCPRQHHRARPYASLEATDAWRIARFLASDSERRSRCSFSRVVSILWYSCCSVFFCAQPPGRVGCQASAWISEGADEGSQPKLKR